MSDVILSAVRRLPTWTAAAVILYGGALATQAPVRAADAAGTPGRIDFAAADLPPANIEVDLNEGTIRDLFGIGDAAVAGVADALTQSIGQSESAEGTRLAAQQLAAVRQILQLVTEVVHEVRVRGYERIPEGSAPQFDSQLRAENWETVVRLRHGAENVQVSLLRREGAIRGVLVVAAGNDGLLLANLVGDVSPANAKKLTSAATKIGLENGLQQVLEMKMRQLKHRLPPPEGGAPHTVPSPPSAPRPDGVR